MFPILARKHATDTPHPHAQIAPRTPITLCALYPKGVPNNYETDLIFPILARAAELAGVDYAKAEPPNQTALKVIGDHTRAGGRAGRVPAPCKHLGSCQNLMRPPLCRQQGLCRWEADGSPRDPQARGARAPSGTGRYHT